MKKRNYYGFSGWTGDDWRTVAKSFATMLGPEPEFVYAVYSTPAYEGSARVIFKLGRQWFEADGSHCSCYSLEGQWEPQTINIREHLKAVQDGRQILLVADTEGDYPEATQENFNKWLKWASKQ